MNKDLVKIIGEKDQIIDEILRENNHLRERCELASKEIERLKYYEELYKEHRCRQDKDCW